jgi:hypothetical protein
LRVSRLAGIGSGPTEVALTSSHVSTRRVVSPTSARRKTVRTSVTVACALAAVAVAGVIAYRSASSTPQTAPASSASMLAPGEPRVEAAALKPSVAPAPAAAPRVSVFAPERRGVAVDDATEPAKSRVRPIESDSAGAGEANARRSASARRVQASRAELRAKPSAAPTPAPSARPSSVDDEEFPGLSRAGEPRRSERAADDDSSLGANASPLLD